MDFYPGQSRKLRIAAVVSYFPTKAEPHSGMPVFNQMRAMSQLADVSIFVAHPSYPSFGPFRPKTFLSPTTDTAHTIEGFDLKYVTYPAIPGLSRPLNGRMCGEKLLPHIKQAKPDVILSYIVYPEGYAAVHAGRQLGIPVVVGATGSDVRCIPDKLTKWLVRSTLRRADYVVTKSRELRTCSIALGADDTTTRAILNGCDTRVFLRRGKQAMRTELGIDPESELIVFTGRLVAVKGVNELLGAAGLLHNRGRRVEVALIGTGPLQGALRAEASQQGIGDRVRFLGMLGQQDVSRWLAAADVFCLPSYSEGCPNVVLEALACGRPVVATNVGGVPEIVDDSCGMLVPPANAEALADALARTLDRSWDEEMITRRHGRSWTDMARETLDVCAQACGKVDVATRETATV